MTELTLFIDGASRGNPGPAGIGIRIEIDGELHAEYCEYIGCATNNVAEYRALIKGLKMAADSEANRVTVFSDSELVVRQMNGAYKVKNEGLLPLYQTARMLSRTFDGFQIEHVRRERNREADQLANRGIAEKEQKEKRE